VFVYWCVGVYLRKVLPIALLAIVVAGLSACGDSVGPGEPQVPDVTAYTAGPARENLVAGHFVLPTPKVGVVPEIDRQKAHELTLAWLADLAPFLAAALSEDRGAAIDLTRLAICRETFYAGSSFVLDNPNTMADPFYAAAVRPFGSQWVVSLCAPGSRLEVSLAVAALSTDLQVVNGHLSGPRVGGNWFVSLGVPVGLAVLPPRAEEAVLLAAIATGRRIVNVPELVARGPRQGIPQVSFWRLQLESPATVERQGGTGVVNTSELFVGRLEVRRSLALFIAAADQPSKDSVWYTIIDTVNVPPNPDVQQLLVVDRRADVPSNFEEVTALP
jgi:hypothetical protein